ncbi:Nin one binding Zn-ribbon like-domain-containing protein, partial [Piptocephalis cylindrospora]
EDQEETPKDKETSLPGWAEEDDGQGEWITPTNVLRHKAREYGHAFGDEEKNNKPVDVSCMTADFAMQNVLLQMGLNLLSVDGIRIKQVKTFVLRCHGCMKVTTDMNKKFCPSCGGPTLNRVSARLDKYGKLHLLLKSNYSYNVRGTQYSLSKPRGGREGEKLILREDQKEFQRSMAKYRRRKEGVDVFDVDFIPSLLIGRGKNPTPEEPFFGHGRRNPNHSRKKVNKKKNH